MHLLDNATSGFVINTVLLGVSYTPSYIMYAYAEQV